MSRQTYKAGIFMLVALLILGLATAESIHIFQASTNKKTISVYLTTPDQKNLLAQQGNIAFGSSSPGSNTITVNEGTSYQQMVGFGAEMSDSSAYLIYNKMSANQRTTLMKNLFSTSSGIGLDFLNQSIGASDLSLNAYTYDDVPLGQTDTSLSHFSIAHDTMYTIPLLQQALQININVKIMGTPWSPPAWMKSDNALDGGGTLNTSAYDAYAQYFADYIKAYQAQGIPIYAIAPQNEPLNLSTMPAMNFSASAETNFIANKLGPTLAANGLSTKILGGDQNWDVPNYPTTIMSDATANHYTPATAWQCYAGDASAMTTFHDAYPTKNIYETGCADGTWVGTTWSDGLQNTMEQLINSTRNWSKSVVRGAIALDTNNGPALATTTACTTCGAVVTVDQSTGTVTYNADYYGLAQASKFVTPGAYRIDSNSFGAGNLEDVAFKNPDGSKVLVAYNGGSNTNNFLVQWGDKTFSYTLVAGAAVTFKWSGTTTASSAPVAAATATPTPLPTPTPTPVIPTAAAIASGTGSMLAPGLAYDIISKNSGLALDVINQSTADGGGVQQWPLVTAGQANQQWIFTPTDPGYYYITNKNSGKVLDDTGWSTTVGTPVQQWTEGNKQANQQWSLIPADSGYYYIKNRYTGYVLDVTGQSTASGAIVHQWTQIDGQANQEWKIQIP